MTNEENLERELIGFMSKYSKLVNHIKTRDLFDRIYDNCYSLNDPLYKYVHDNCHYGSDSLSKILKKAEPSNIILFLKAMSHYMLFQNNADCMIFMVSYVKRLNHYYNKISYYEQYAEMPIYIVVPIVNRQKIVFAYNIMTPDENIMQYEKNFAALDMYTKEYFKSDTKITFNNEWHKYQLVITDKHVNSFDDTGILCKNFKAYMKKVNALSSSVIDKLTTCPMFLNASQEIYILLSLDALADECPHNIKSLICDSTTTDVEFVSKNIAGINNTGKSEGEKTSIFNIN